MESRPASTAPSSTVTVVVNVVALAALLFLTIRANTAWYWAFFVLALVVLAVRLLVSRRRRARLEHPTQ